MNEKPLVSIISVTYNQAKYIRECLDSFLMQKTNFKFEILIHDDASTDGTTEIVREYEKKYPDIIKPIYETENKFSKGISIYRTYNLPRVRGKYVAVCEGDDYWTDPYKLQKQVDFLEAHPDYSICFHSGRVIFDGYDDRKEYIYPNKKTFQKEFTYENLLKINFILASSVMYRWGFNNKNIWEVYPDGLIPGDWYLHLLHAKLGKIGHIDGIMSVYRRNHGGIWSDTLGNVGRLHQKFALQEFIFYDSAYKYITNYSEDYYINVLIPIFKEIYGCLVEYKENDKLHQAFKTYPEYFEKICNDYYKEKEIISQKLAQTNDKLKKNETKKKNDLNLILNKYGIYRSYYRYKFLSKVLFGKKRKHYKHKAEIYHRKVRAIRKLNKFN